MLLDLLSNAVSDFKNVKNEVDILKLANELSESLGFNYVRLYIIAPNAISRPSVTILNSAPSEWGRIYERESLFGIDPSVIHCINSTIPIRWSELNRFQTGGTISRVFASAAEHGLVDAISVPWHSPSGYVGVASFICNCLLSKQHAIDAEPVLMMLTNYIFNSYVNIDLLRVEQSGSCQVLSDREIEVCLWALEGKQASDIGQILGLTTRTINFHLTRVTEKLGSVNKTQALSLALKKGFIKSNVKRSNIENVDLIKLLM